MAVRMPFGKYRGYPLEHIPTGYLRWLLRSCDLYPALEDALRHELFLRLGPNADDEDDGFGRSWQRSAPPPPRAKRQQPARQDVDDLIEAGRRTLARKFHPDAGGDTARMQAINHAADWLQARIREQLG